MTSLQNLNPAVNWPLLKAVIELQWICRSSFDRTLVTRVTINQLVTPLAKDSHAPKNINSEFPLKKSDTLCWQTQEEKCPCLKGLDKQLKTGIYLTNMKVPKEIAKSKQMEIYYKPSAQLTSELHSLPPFRLIQTLDTLRWCACIHNHRWRFPKGSYDFMV